MLTNVVANMDERRRRTELIYLRGFCDTRHGATADGVIWACENPIVFYTFYCKCAFCVDNIVIDPLLFFGRTA